MTHTTDVFSALASLGERLDALVTEAGSQGWLQATPAEGWSVATQISHLAWTDEISLLAISDQGAFGTVVEQAMADPTGFVDAGAEEIAASERATVLHRWRTARQSLGVALGEADPAVRIPWFGPPMRPISMATARIMETWAHGIDVADALGKSVVEDPAFNAALPHIAHLGVRTRAFAYQMNGLEAPAAEIRVELTYPDGEAGAKSSKVWAHGNSASDQSVTGSLQDFCLLVTQRIHWADTNLIATGEDAEEWLGLAQAFAGLPGGGRKEGSCQ